MSEKNNHPGKIVIDLDGVIVGPKPESGYQDCEINGLVVQRLRKLKELGWTIAIHTSRNVKSFEHNLGKLTAVTVPAIVEFLQRHDCPFDEIWPAKPWTGHVGFYVDDRAVRPQEFLELTTSELLAQSRASFYDPAKPLWRVGNDQSWIVIDLRENPSPLFSGDLVAAINEEREAGFRTALILPPFLKISPGQDEELRRLGALWWRFQAGPSIDSLLLYVQREMVLDNLIKKDAVIHPLVVPVVTQGPLSSRHFNKVEAFNERVIKTAKNLDNVKKLRFELDWLQAVAASSVDEPVVIDDVKERENGYTMARAAGGSLSRVLLRHDLGELECNFIANELTKLWENLEVDDDRAADHVLSNTRTLPSLGLKNEHAELFQEKSISRINRLSKLLEESDVGDSNNYKWTVNGVKMGSIYDTVKKLLAAIPVQKNENRGVWHGDFCPGNIVLTRDVLDDEFELRLIDPRGTIDGELVSLYGDRRYDLGKLAHALCWGYDAILAGWRDVFWTTDVGSVEVRLRVWDEGSNVLAARRRVWNRLVLGKKIKAGSVGINDKQVHAITALQLITCAPLHREDPSRMVALIARGMEVARHALS